MDKCDTSWQWCNARKKLSSGEISSATAVDGFSEISSVAGGSSEEFILKRRRCMDVASLRTFQRISQQNALKFRVPDIGLQVEHSTTEVNLFKNGGLIEANSSKSPISVIQGRNASSSSEACTSDSDKFSCYPHGDFSPEQDCYVERSARFGVFYARKKPSVSGRHQKAGHEQSSREISKVDAEVKQFQLNEGMSNLRPISGTEPNSKRPKRSKSSSFQIQKEKSEFLFDTLHILADVAVRLLVPSYKEEGKNTSNQWVRKAICHPTGVSFWQKRVIRRAKNAFKCASANVYAERLMYAHSNLLLTSELGSSGCLKVKVMEGGVTDKDQEGIQRKKPSVSRRHQKEGHEQSSREISMVDAEDKQFQLNEGMSNLRPISGAEPNSKRPKRSKSSSFQIQKEKSEFLFDTLHILADVAVRLLVPSYKEEGKNTSNQWVRKAICHPTGVSFWQKRVIRRAKNAFKCASANVYAEKLMYAHSNLLLTSELGSSGCLKVKVMEGGVTDKDQEGIQSPKAF